MAQKKIILAVIGGGAAGLAAAVTAARLGAQVTVYERGARVGRKLLATGNGRCNLTNRQAAPKYYHGQEPDFVQPALARFPVAETIAFFDSLGVMVVEEDGGKCYPRSLQAAAVLDALRLECERLGVEMVCDCEITRLQPLKGGFNLYSATGVFYAQKVIVAAGGAASAPLGGCEAGYQLLAALGHRRTGLHPAIVQLKCDAKATKALNGIKIQAMVTLREDEKRLGQESGEVLFTDYGLSGPPILQLSSLATRHLGGKKQLTVGLDVFSDMTEAALGELLSQRAAARPEMLLENFTVGMLNKRLGQITLKECGIAPLSRQAGSLTQAEIARYAALLKDWRLVVRDTNGLRQAQVTAGGVETSGFDSCTMASRLVSGLYACGEVLDIDGDCGGYNLQWAWSSGRLAAESAMQL